MQRTCPLPTAVLNPPFVQSSTSLLPFLCIVFLLNTIELCVLHRTCRFVGGLSCFVALPLEPTNRQRVPEIPTSQSVTKCPTNREHPRHQRHTTEVRARTTSKNMRLHRGPSMQCLRGCMEFVCPPGGGGGSRRAVAHNRGNLSSTPSAKSEGQLWGSTREQLGSVKSWVLAPKSGVPARVWSLSCPAGMARCEGAHVGVSEPMGSTRGQHGRDGPSTSRFCGQFGRACLAVNSDGYPCVAAAHSNERGHFLETWN